MFFCTGLWHGASINFVIWGLIHGTFSVLEETKIFAKMISNKVIGWIYTALVVTVAFVFFRSEDIHQTLCFLKNMVCFWNLNGSVMSQYIIYFHPLNIFIIIISVIGIFPVKRILPDNSITRVAGFVFSIICLLLCIMQLSADKYNPFIYYRF